ncbi:MAG: MFS transporter [Candidatus Thermoplasmatota archaeon]|nr:MFS transporter [Euryarchaeota archaeon]MBU4032671.1 MFS transporter [Candidatus Thermoplasmatota archaeon]MBU4071085.1 MFS transporter [Candidatus Thermoplasmatota archaeon]MBU4145176.1 MFS transporter [Candidatus Thermoplasmatota archaeon]MBU4591127.1 MFS transporter [Candidatus Thermoplasmatota archaeon]
MKAESLNFLSNAALFSSLLLIPLFAEELGASAGEIGILVASYSAANLLASYIFGRLSDIHGRRIFLISGLVLSAITCAAQCLAHDTVTLLVTRVLLGFCAGIYPAALLAYAYENKKRMSRFLAWGSGGWGAGTVVAGIVATVFSIRAPFLFSALLMALAIPVALRMPFRNDVKMAIPLFPVKIIKKNISVYLPVLVRHTGACAIWVMYPMFIRGLGGVGINIFFWVGIMYGINSFTQFLVMPRLKKRSGILLPAGIIASIATFLLFPLCKDIWQLMPTQVLLAVSWALIYVGSVKFMMARNEERATVTGFLNSVLQLSAILGALVGGFIVQMTNDMLAPMYFAAGMSGVALVLYYALRASGKHKRLNTVQAIPE